MYACVCVCVSVACRCVSESSVYFIIDTGLCCYYLFIIITTMGRVDDVFKFL